MTDTILHDHDDDGIDRRGFLKCMAWAGTGMLWAVNSGVLSSVSLRSLGGLGPAALKGELFFAQISDSHIGFSKEANPDVTATLQIAVERRCPTALLSSSIPATSASSRSRASSIPPTR
jgi:Icc protein